MATADIGGVSLYYEDSGTATEGTVLLIHGIGASGEDWEFQVPALVPSRRVIVPDLRGYGRSGHRGPYSIERFAADLYALLDRLGVQQCDIVGHSMGGAVALQMAIDAPQRVRKLVICDSLPSFKPDSPKKWGLFFYRMFMMAVFGPRLLSRAVNERLFPAPEQAALRQRVATRNGARNTRRVYLQTLPQLVRWSLRERLVELRMPVMIVMAEHDYFPVADGQAYAAAIPGARFELLQGLHHSAPIEAPARFNPLLLAFLRG